MNAIPLVFNAPKANINVNSVSPINANSIRTNNKLINATQGMNIGGAAGMLGGGGFSNEAQLRQEVNTSIVALKREAFSLEKLIAQAAQTLQDINKRLSELEGKQGDYVKKADATVESVGGDGKYISAISEADGKINATATDLGNMVPVNSVTSGDMHAVTSSAVADKIASLGKQVLIYNGDTYDGTVKSLTQSLKNFRYVYIGLKTNIDYDYVLIPTDNINNGFSIMRTLMSSSNFGQVALPFPYQSTVQVTILSDTTFKCESRYNNINWVLKVYAIWGIN